MFKKSRIIHMNKNQSFVRYQSLEVINDNVSSTNGLHPDRKPVAEDISKRNHKQISRYMNPEGTPQIHV